jgi:hypothetical protein
MQHSSPGFSFQPTSNGLHCFSPASGPGQFLELFLAVTGPSGSGMSDDNISHVYRVPAELNIEITKTLSKSSSRVDINREASLKANSSTIHPASVDYQWLSDYINCYYM